MQSNRSLPNNLHDDIKNQIEKQLPDSDKGRLALTCYDFYKHGLNISTHSHFNTRIRTKCEKMQTLLKHVVLGEQIAAEAMLQIDPGLLLEKSIVKDYSGRRIYGTALQIALGAEDVCYHDHEECMTEMILKYFKLLPNAEEKIVAQTKEQFPDGHEIEEETRKEKDLAALEKIKDTMLTTDATNAHEIALQEFRRYLQPKEVIKKGKHFNIQLLIEAFKIYARCYNQFGGGNSEKNNFYWRKIIGFIQRFLPMCYAQAICQCIYDIVKENGDNLKRSCIFRHSIRNNTVYYPLDSDDDFSLGYDYAASGVPRASGNPANATASASLLQTISSKKQQRCKMYTAVNDESNGISLINKFNY